MEIKVGGQSGLLDIGGRGGAGVAWHWVFLFNPFPTTGSQRLIVVLPQGQT